MSGDLRDWAAISGVLATFGLGVWGVWMKLTEKADRVKVGLGAVRPEIDYRETLHVVSRCDHPIKLADYGFVDSRGQICSLPYMFEAAGAGDDFDVMSRGTTALEKRNDSFEIGLPMKERQVAACARTTAQDRYTLGFAPDVAIWRRLYLRFKLRWLPLEFQ